MGVPQAFSEACSAVAFYGVEPGAGPAAGFHAAVTKWFTDLGCPPDRLSVHGPGHSGKPGAFARVNAKLQKGGFDGVRGMSITSMIPGGQIPVDDYLLSAAYDGGGESLFAYVVARSSLAALSPTGLLPVARALAQEMKPSYGIGYTRDHRLGPAMYAIGICQGLGVGLTGDAYEEARSISRWCDLGMVKQVYRGGVLRDVYPWNFLTQPQLSRLVGGVPLERWVRQEAGRGAITSFCDGVSLWEVNETDLPQVRAALRQAGAIFDWRTHS